MNHIDYTRPSSERRVVLTYKNFPVAHNVSHIGLGVSALNTAKVLQANGIACDVWPILGAKELAQRIQATNPKPSHVVIGAPWIQALDLQAHLVFKFPLIQFSVVCHSNVGFLQNDPTAITNFRQDLNLEQGALNFKACGNSRRFSNWIQTCFNRPCTWLPNLYYLEGSPVYRRPWSGGTLKMGSFGAVRSLKNHLSSAAAALEIANDLHTDVEFHISVGRIEGGSTVVRAIDAMTAGVPGFTLVKDEWFQWPQFRRLVRSMHLLMQPSYTESFNMVTADGASESIPSVTSDAIEWTPSYWQADVDDPLDIARIGKSLLMSANAGADGFNALAKYNAEGVAAWKSWLGLT
jgi:hypothetical protein